MGMADKSEDPRKFVSQGALLQKLKVEMKKIRIPPSHNSTSLTLRFLAQIMAKDDSAVVIRNLAKLLCAHAK